MDNRMSTLVVIGLLLCACAFVAAQSTEMVGLPAGTFARGVPGGTGYPQFDETPFGGADDYSHAPDKDPTGPPTGDWIWYPTAEPERSRVVRDGGTRVKAQYLNVATRFAAHPGSDAREVIGLRLVRSTE